MTSVALLPETREHVSDRNTLAGERAVIIGNRFEGD
jgi:hypothetical protein